MKKLNKEVIRISLLIDKETLKRIDDLRIKNRKNSFLPTRSEIIRTLLKSDKIKK